VSKVLVVTGMHRSGTSLVANYLAKAGIDMGSELIPPDVGNPHGYYEDAVIHDFHRRAMRKVGIADTFTVTPDMLPLRFDEEDRADAQRVISERTGFEQWGWKEPRTSLYLDLWNDVLPTATYLFLFRRPDAVLDSLMRRASNQSIVDRPATGLEIWLAHNTEMVRFAQLHPERTLWCEADGFIAAHDAFLDTLRSAGFRLASVPISDVFAEGAFHTDVRMRARAVTKKNRGLWRECSALYEQLKQLADSSSRVSSA
jgi:hypothetical protein